MSSWSTACPDWEARILAGRTLVPALPLFEAEAARAERIFNRLRIPDVIGKPTMAESGTEWLLPIVRAIFGSYDPEANRRMIQEFFWLVPKKNSKSSGAAAIMVTVLIVNRRPLAEALLVAPTKEIANIAYKQAWGIIQADPELAKLFHGQHHVRTPEAQAAIGRARDTLEMSETKSLFTDGVTSFVTDLRRGGDAATALSNAFGNAADRLIAKVMDSAISSAFGAMGGGSGSGIGGFFSSLFGGGAGAGASPTGGVRLFDVGGYTGAGGRLEPAGIVHRGEVVWSQGDVARVGGVAVAEAIRRGLPGYSAGGPVGAPAWMPPPANAGAGATPAFNFYDQRPAGSPEIEPTVNRRSDGGFDVIVRSVEGRMGQRAAGGQGPFKQAAGGAGFRNG